LYSKKITNYNILLFWHFIKYFIFKLNPQSMKRVNLLVKTAIVFGLVWLASCKADDILNTCTTCTETTTQVSSEYCGTIVEVQTFEQTLYNTSGQDWTCVRN